MNRRRLLMIGAPVAVIAGTVAFVRIHTFAPQEQNAHEHSRNSLKQISLALHQYHERYDCLPPAYVLGKDGKPWHSWRVLLLPFLGEQGRELHRRYRFDEPWNGPHNKHLAGKIPTVFASPYLGEIAGHTPYLAIVGSRTAWPGPHSSTYRRDFKDGTSNTISLIENVDSKINWLDPRDLTHLEAQQLFRKRARSEGDPERNPFLVACADGSVRRLNPIIRRGVFHAMLTPNGGTPLVDADLVPEEAKRLPGFDFGPATDAGKLTGSEFLPHLEGKLDPSRNRVYCATFQLAWDDLREIYRNEPIRLSSKSRLAEELNRRPFPRRSLSPECYAAVSGSIKQIRAVMSQRFPEVRPSLTPPAARPYVTCYAYLEKNMPFDEDFDRLADPLLFRTDEGTRPVNSFGLKPTDTKSQTGKAVFESQVTVLDYVNDHDFILQLSTVGPQKDRIVLAKIAPGETLQSMLATVRQRTRKPHRHHTRGHLETVDTLAIPMMLFNVERHYDELNDRKILNDPPGGRLQGAWVDAARQIIRFRLDETGGLLISEAEIQIVGSFGDDPPPPPPRPRRFVFDRPFLMILQEEQADQPYFVAWIANTELLEQYKR